VTVAPFLGKTIGAIFNIVQILDDGDGCPRESLGGILPRRDMSGVGDPKLFQQR
jgi:hypothetical protein